MATRINRMFKAGNCEMVECGKRARYVEVWKHKTGPHGHPNGARRLCGECVHYAKGQDARKRANGNGRVYRPSRFVPLYAPELTMVL